MKINAFSWCTFVKKMIMVVIVNRTKMAMVMVALFIKVSMHLSLA